MKNYLVFFLLLSCTISWAQITPVSNSCGISFNYDNTGNRIRRYVCLNLVGLQYQETTQNEQLTSQLDLAETFKQAGFSEDLETEIEQLEALLSQPATLELDPSKKTTASDAALTKEKLGDLSEFVLFPNPTMSSFSVRGKDLRPQATLSIVSMDGRILRQLLLGEGTDIDVSDLPVGAYLITLVDGSERRASVLVKSDQSTN
ncbi:MAG: T9SS type A sorting domain-containing protein [Bacteroidota bacterium]